MSKKYRVVRLEYLEKGETIFVIEKKLRLLFFAWWSRYEWVSAGDRSVMVLRYHFENEQDAIMKCDKLNQSHRKLKIKESVYG